MFKTYRSNEKDNKNLHLINGPVSKTFKEILGITGMSKKSK